MYHCEFGDRKSDWYDNRSGQTWSFPLWNSFKRKLRASNKTSIWGPVWGGEEYLMSERPRDLVIYRPRKKDFSPSKKNTGVVTLYRYSSIQANPWPTLQAEGTLAPSQKDLCSYMSGPMSQSGYTFTHVHAHAHTMPWDTFSPLFVRLGSASTFCP